MNFVRKNLRYMSSSKSSKPKKKSWENTKIHVMAVYRTYDYNEDECTAYKSFYFVT